MAKALLMGTTGQDGAYMAHALLAKGWDVIGSTRDRFTYNSANLCRLQISDQLKLININPSDFRSVHQAILTIEPDLLVNLSGQTSVALSFEQPVEAIESIATATLNILESLRMIRKKIKFINIGSSECFGETVEAATEETAFRPVSPYAVAKSTAAWHVSAYRQAYGIWASTAIMSNHESPLRGKQFITQKLIACAKQCALDPSYQVNVGDLTVIRDWGWAPDYVDALARMAHQDEPSDYIIATGESNSLNIFAEKIFTNLGMDYRDHLVLRKELCRPLELKSTKLNPAKAAKTLGWSSTLDLDGIVEKLLNDEVF